MIPGRTVLGLELRDLDAKKISEMLERLKSEANHVGSLSGTTLSFTESVRTTPALMNKSSQNLIDATARGIHHHGDAKRGGA
jgi:N-carbamoyl-L-amino-acid hydrolase